MLKAPVQKIPDTITELKPIYDGRKSFYRKAYVYGYKRGKKELKSYETIVLTLTPNKIVFYGEYSMTTRRHICEFLSQEFGLEIALGAGNIRAILMKYPKGISRTDFLHKYGNT